MHECRCSECENAWAISVSSLIRLSLFLIAGRMGNSDLGCQPFAHRCGHNTSSVSVILPIQSYAAHVEQLLAASGFLLVRFSHCQSNNQSINLRQLVS